jgi:hypothetical protein
MAALSTPNSRRTRARIAALTRWSRTPDATSATAPARRAFASRFEHEVDPDGVLPPDVRARMAEAAKKAYYTRLAYQSAKARRR